MKPNIWVTEIAAAMGLVSWLSPRDVWLRAVAGERRDFEQTAAMKIGIGMESAILSLGEEFFGAKVIAADSDDFAEKCGAGIIGRSSDGNPWRGRCDALAVRDGKEFVVEIKSVRDYGWAELPPHYRIQLQAYLDVYGVDYGELWVLHSGIDLRKYEVHRDEDLLEEMFFAADGILSLDIPPPVSSEADARRAIADMTAKMRRGTHISLTDGNAINAVRELLAKRAQRREMSSEVSAIDAEIKKCEASVIEILGEQDSAEVLDARTGDEFDISVRQTERKGFTVNATVIRSLTVKRRHFEKQKKGVKQ